MIRPLVELAITSKFGGDTERKTGIYSPVGEDLSAVSTTKAALEVDLYKGPIKKIGILGGGQLARMLTLAAYPLGMTTLCIDPKGGSSANQVTEVITADYTDQAQLQNFAQQVDFITYETENIPLQTAEFLSQHHTVFPSTQALATAQDRLQEKTLFQALNVPTPGFVAINSLDDLLKGVKVLGFPCVLKTRRFGYDGKGQRVLRKPQDIDLAWQALGLQPLLLEEFIAFEKELSLIAVRGQQELVFYSLTQNEHQEGILRLSTAPYQDKNLQQLAETYTKKLLEHLDYRGVFAIEFFCKEGELIANEMAPRVHNSGHWTIEGASTSQFENHIRAITGLPLGNTQSRGYSAMFNCIGTEPDIKEILNIPDVHYHHYFKSPVEGRKLAHFTLSTPDLEKYDKALADLKKIIE